MSCVAKGRHCPCEGRVQEHHAVPKSRIRRLHKSLVAAHRRGGPKPPSLTSLLRDRRNLVRICKRHHELVTDHVIYLAAEDLPACVWAFAAELDDWCDGEPFVVALESEYPRRRAA